MGDDETAVVEDVVADQPIEERNELCLCALAISVGYRLDLRECAVEAVSDLNVTATQLAQELHVVVPGHAMRRLGFDHVAYEADCVQDLRTAVDQVADEDRATPVWVPIHRTAVRELTLSFLGDVAELAKQQLQFGAAAVDVTNQVEWTM